MKKRYRLTEALVLAAMLLTNATVMAQSNTPRIGGNVYGGGNLGPVSGNVEVNITGGTMEKDVYGGGALADTNLGNWNANVYVEVTGLTVGTSSVTGFYTKDGDNYTIINDAEAKAEEGTTYYRQEGTWTDATLKSSRYTTTVNLTGGLIHGDAYGGGLGQKDGFNGKTGDIAAVVWGDISVNLGSSDEGSTATAFQISNYDDDHSTVVKSGRVFGCNNLNGSPQGDVKVTVYKTVAGNVSRTAHEQNNEHRPQAGAGVTPTYEVADVYGGGNLADYAPTESGKKAYVKIMKCDVSIQSVYGGGNAAAVPGTDVLVNGAYEIGEVFGGGNGKDSYTTDGGTTWGTNPGANVNGNATTLLKGGYIHEAYGGSNSKGTISGNVSIDKSSGGDCDLTVIDLYGAGKDADIEGDLIMVMGCSTTRTENIYGCSKNANVKGNVELTITSGEYGKVFGGNNQSGSIFGHIIVNIEEVGCSPIIIDELYLGGNDAAYSVYGYYHAKKYVDDDNNLFLDAGKTIPLYMTDGNYYKDEANTIRLYIDNDNKLYLDQEKTRALYMPRTSADNDGNEPVSFPEVNQNTVLTLNQATGKYSQYADPEVNIISCTRIGMVFGGGLGTGATLYGNPSVNINMIPGVKASAMTTNETYNSIHLGEIGTVYGGGYAADVIGNTTVNIGTSQSVNEIVWDGTNDKPVYESDGKTPSTTSKTVVGAYITGNVYGGGKGEASLTPSSDSGDAFECAKAMVGKDNEQPTDLNGGTQVNIYNGMVIGNVYGGGEVGRVEKNTVVTIGQGEGVAPGGSTSPTSAPVIKGSVFGAGAGKKTHGYSALVRGNSTVTIKGNAKVEQNVYGGGEAATVGRYRLNNAGMPTEPWGGDYGGGTCTVTIGGYAEIGPDNMKMKNATGGPHDYGHVFGAGMGVLPYDGYADDAKPQHMDGDKVNGAWKDHKKEYGTYATTQGNDADYINFIKTLALASITYVTIKDYAFVKGSVYGGSENGFVQADTHVTIQDHCQIGNGYAQMADDGTYLDKLSPSLTPLAVNRRYTDAEWAAGKLIPDATNEHDLYDLVHDKYYTSSLPECASWPYGQAANAEDRYAPYDKFANQSGELGKYANGKTTEGGRFVGDDGHTFYGNVFGGGSGYYPYRPGKWFESAGAVYGNTYLTIKGGHILTSVYGGNEMTDVGKYDDIDRLNLTSGGNCYVTMIGGTLGVPRTLGQIDKHPVTCYLFGAGKGDQRVFFNKSTNVGNAVIHISDDARIYGSVFGGGEDGHVMRNVTMNIGGAVLPTAVSTALTSVFTGVSLSGSKTVGEVKYPYIGTTGTSYVDGNVFGAGRGFGGDAYTAGNVAGTVTMNIYGGTMLGSIYGGGRLGSVGYGLFDAKTSAGADMPGYGEMRPDNTTESQTGESSTVSNFPRGYVYMTIGNDDGTGPIIGNTLEYKVPSASNGPKSNDQPTLPADIKDWSADNWTTWKKYNNVPKTEFDTTTGRLTHTKGGNVFAGGMGRFYQLDGTSYIEAVDWWKLGCVKSTTLTIKGGTIKSNVYGGGELGQVVGYHTTGDAHLSTEITIQNTNNTKIGTEVKETVITPAQGETSASTSEVTSYTFGSVFGGGYGSLLDQISFNVTVNGTTTTKTSYPKLIAGLVSDSTKIDMQGGKVLASIYGGGEMASVDGSADVRVSDGIIGLEPITVSGTKRYFGGAKMGNVYGGGSGHNNTVRSGRILKNTNVNISGGNIYHNVYGGGAYGTVGDFKYLTGSDGKVSGIEGFNSSSSDVGVARVKITGGTIGYDGKENGMVFGSSRGDINQPGERDDHTAWVYDTHVIIGSSGQGTTLTTPLVKGSVYGSGENGHTYHDTEVIIHSGTIGVTENETDDNGTPEDTTDDKITPGAAYPYRGNVYGGGCGTDKYYSTHAEETHDGNGQLFNPLAGIVYGTTTVNIKGGQVVRNVYGAGAMGSVGRTVTTTTTEGETTTTTTTITGGTTTINVSGGRIGVDGTVGDGNVFGAARGNADAVSNEAALVRKETSVSVTGGIVKGNVYGGGELGCVGTFTISSDYRTFTWKDTTGVNNTAANSDNKNTGICNVEIDGSSAVIDGHVFGAGKGKDDTFWCEKGIAYSTNVSIKNGTVNGNVYGGGEVGRVETDTQVKIGDGDGTVGGASAPTPTITGSVFGGGAGVETHGYSALVRGNTTVTVEGNAGIGHSVYGGGEIASVGRYALDAQKMPSILQGGGYCYVTVKGHAAIVDDVFGAGKGVTPHFDKDNADLSKRSRRMTLKSDWESRVGADRFDWDYLESESDYSTYLETLALATHPEVTIDGSAAVSGSVFGGGELGLTKGSVVVNIQGGTITEDVYGGGSLANTNTTSSVDTNGDGTADTTIDPTTTVNLKGGIVTRNVYGGGLGRLAAGPKAAVYYTAEEAAAYNTANGLSSGAEGFVSEGDVKTPAVDAVSAVEAKVYGDVSVKLNEPTTSEGNTIYGDCDVKGTIFGCNNLNGSPQKGVTVHVWKTVHKENGAVQAKPTTKNDTTYELEAVYGGGNLAAYYPDDLTARESAVANVIIDGCNLTSIGSVYGGGNAASVPATEVLVNGTYEIGTVFGGGNGADEYILDDKTYENPGANVGYQNYTAHTWNATSGKYEVTTNSDASTLAGRQTYAYGIGKAHATILGGTVHKVYGGSDTRGNVRVEARATLNDGQECTFDVGEAYGGGNNAMMDGNAILDIDCISGLGIAYGGASNADVNGDVVLNIVNGTYGQVFGGNDKGGAIRGAITVNINETGCRPVIIGELYAGGNQAAYSVYGYDIDANGKPQPLTELPQGATKQADPQLNVYSFTSIGNIFGGGYGANAKMVASPHVNINVYEGKYATRYNNKNNEIAEGSEVFGKPVPSHKSGAIGAINNVYGGGNEAEVIGNPTVNIGTLTGDKLYEEVAVAADASVAGKFTFTAATGTAAENTTYYKKNGGVYEEVKVATGADVKGYYTKAEATGTAAENTTYYEEKIIKGVDIRGNVFGGGNNAAVTGDTNIFIGKKKE